jgi:hypothetical protein
MLNCGNHLLLTLGLAWVTNSSANVITQLKKIRGQAEPDLRDHVFPTPDAEGTIEPSGVTDAANPVSGKQQSDREAG